MLLREIHPHSPWNRSRIASTKEQFPPILIDHYTEIALRHICKWSRPPLPIPINGKDLLRPHVIQHIRRETLTSEPELAINNGQPQQLPRFVRQPHPVTMAFGEALADQRGAHLGGLLREFQAFERLLPIDRAVLHRRQIQCLPDALSLLILGDAGRGNSLLGRRQRRIIHVPNQSFRRVCARHGETLLWL